VYGYPEITINPLNPFYPLTASFFVGSGIGIPEPKYPAGNPIPAGTGDPLNPFYPLIKIS